MSVVNGHDYQPALAGTAELIDAGPQAVWWMVGDRFAAVADIRQSHLGTFGFTGDIGPGVCHDLGAICTREKEEVNVLIA